MEKKKMPLPKTKFHSAGRPGVVYLIAGDGERHYYIRYRTPDGRQRFEKAIIPGVRMSAAKADQRYRKHLKVPFGDREPSSLKPLDIDRLRLSLATGHAKSTTITVLGLIRRIERYGASRGFCAWLSFPIILKGKKLGKDPRVKKAPTDEQFEIYIKTCEKWPDVQAGNFQLFIAYTGVRRGSARNLKWEDIDLDNATAVLKDSKTGDVQVVLSDDAVTLVDILQASRPDISLARYRGRRIGFTMSPGRGTLLFIIRREGKA
jgi:integrase